MGASSFEWDEVKNRLNQQKHGLSFEEAQHAFLDERRIIFHDAGHTRQEERFFCLGKVDGKIITVRFTYRRQRIRIFGAGYWREGKKQYEKENGLHG
jgi:uncharacterized protein